MNLIRTELVSIRIMATKETFGGLGWRRMLDIEEHDVPDCEKSRRELSRAREPRLFLNE
jgi:hypothetical protein